MVATLTQVAFDDFNGENVLPRSRRVDYTGGDATSTEASSLLTYTLQAYSTHGWPGTANPPYAHHPVQDFILPQLDIPVFVTQGWTMSSFPGMFECKLTKGAPGGLAGNTGTGLFMYPQPGLVQGVQVLNRGNSVSWFQVVGSTTPTYGGTSVTAPATSPNIYQLYYVPSGWPTSVDFPNPNGSGFFTVAPGKMSVWVSDDNGSTYTQLATPSPYKDMPFVPYGIGVGFSGSYFGSSPTSDYAQWDWFKFYLTDFPYGAECHEVDPSTSTSAPEDDWYDFGVQTEVAESTEQDPRSEFE
jgi:hypothetical protein